MYPWNCIRTYISKASTRMLDIEFRNLVVMCNRKRISKSLLELNCYCPRMLIDLYLLLQIDCEFIEKSLYLEFRACKITKFCWWKSPNLKTCRLPIFRKSDIVVREHWKPGCTYMLLICSYFLNINLSSLIFSLTPK